MVGQLTTILRWPSLIAPFNNATILVLKISKLHNVI
jgi:hypothetical protein